MEKCPVCRNYSVSDYSQGKKCHTSGCSVRVYRDGSYSRIRHDSDKIRRVRKYADGREVVMKEFAHP